MSRAELRKRNSTNLKESKDGAERIKAMILASEPKLPVAVRPYVKHVATGVAMFLVAWDIVSPYLTKAYALGLQAYNNLPDDLLHALLGLLMCFFGGTFAATIAAIEAFRLTGWVQTKQCLESLYEDYLTVKAAHDLDDKEDKDGDGIADVKQISPSELLARKANLVLVSIKDPHKVTNAIVGIGSSLLSVVAVLRVEFAKTVTLGVSIGNQLDTYASRYAVPAIKKVTPSEYAHWIPVVVSYVCKSIAITIAWYIQKVISAIHSGIRGGLMFTRSTINYLNNKGYIKFDHEKSDLDEYLGWVVAGLGVYFQIRCGFSLPFPFNLLLLPLSILEWIIIWVVSDTSIAAA